MEANSVEIESAEVESVEMESAEIISVEIESAEIGKNCTIYGRIYKVRHMTIAPTTSEDENEK